MPYFLVKNTDNDSENRIVEDFSDLEKARSALLESVLFDSDCSQFWIEDDQGNIVNAFKGNTASYDS